MFESSEVSDIHEKIDGDEITEKDATEQLLKIIEEADEEEMEDATKLLSDVSDSSTINSNSSIITEAYLNTENYRIMRDLMRCIYKCIEDGFCKESFLEIIEDASRPRVENIEPTNVEYVEVHRIPTSESIEGKIEDISGHGNFRFEDVSEFETIDEEGRVKSKQDIVLEGGKIGMVTSYHGRNTLKLEIVREMEKQRISSSSEEVRLSNAFNCLTSLIRQDKLDKVKENFIKRATEILSTITRQNIALVVAEFLSYSITKVQNKEEIIDAFLLSINQVHGKSVLHYLEKTVIRCEGGVPEKSEIENTIRKIRGIEVGQKIQVVPPSEQDLKTSYMALSYLTMDSKIKRKLVSFGILKP